VRRRPYSVVLLDEIEKAHPDTFNVLLQVLDEGHLTDNKGRTVNFKNTIVIMTSNLGSQFINEKIEEMYSMDENRRETQFMLLKENVLELLRRTLRPEFLNRIDETIIFTPLTEHNLRDIVRIQAQHLVDTLAEQGFTLQFTESAYEYLASVGFDPQFGARPVKRVLQKEVINALSKAILAGTVQREQPIVVSADAGRVVFGN
jgi:ATP-dependent Clp protease ATP-binding subunit ClpB